jgi:hypothetical protein
MDAAKIGDPMTVPQADFAVYDRSGQLAAVAEAKRKAGTSTDWAAMWFRNFIQHAQSTPPYLLLATPDTVYLWQRGLAASSPPRVLRGSDIFRTYFERSHLTAGDVSPQAFELIVGDWLHDVLSDLWQPVNADLRVPFVESGFLDAVRQGRVESQAAA